MEDQLFINDHPFSPDKFDPPKNEAFYKPKGGLWTSTYSEGTSDWVRWCSGEHFKCGVYVGSVLKVAKEARIYDIRSVADYTRLTEAYPFSPYGFGHIERKIEEVLHGPSLMFKFIDWELISEKWDGVHLVNPGLRWDVMPLSAWDVESTVWLHPEVLTLIKTIKIAIEGEE